MKTEYCIFFPAVECFSNDKFVGLMPSHYEIVSTWAERVSAIKSGGKDLSYDQHAWNCAEAELREMNETYY